jgi:hypothetical protein
MKELIIKHHESLIKEQQETRKDHSSDGCTIGEGGTSGVDSIANSISTSLGNILLIGVDSGELNKIGVDGGVSVAGPVS